MTPVYRHVPLHDAERFDMVSVETVERWKESELSGDEWRFSHLVRFWFHGRAVAKTGAGTVQEALLVAAYQWDRAEVDRELYDLLRVELCSQPDCPSPWRYLLHPVKRYSRAGDLLDRPYRSEQVRGFCARHRRRGDCGLDDADDNYELVLDRSDLHHPDCVWWERGDDCVCPTDAGTVQLEGPAPDESTPLDA